MQYISPDYLSPLADHVETNLYELYRIVAEMRKGEKTNNYSWVDAYPSEWPRYTFDITLTDASHVELLEELEERVNADELPPKLIIRESRSTSAALAHLRASFEQRLEWTGMAASFDIPAPAVSPTTCEVRRASSEEELATWARLVNFTFYGKETGEEPGVFSSLLPLESIRFYLGYWEGEPVATSMGFIHEEVMGVYNITTLERYRGRGIATAVTRAVIDEGRRCGCRGAILQARPAARGVYSSLGFEPAGSLYIFDLASPVQR